MEIVVNNDLRKYKSKDIGMFTFKETGFIVLAGVTGFISKMLQEALFGSYVFELILIPVAIVAMLGFVKPYGLSVRECFVSVFQELFFLPKTLIWKSNFEDERDLP